MAVKMRRSTTFGAVTMTPLIDVVFNLLIFFLVASRFAEEERELDVNLPNVTEALPTTAQPNEIVINIDRQGRYFIDGNFRQLEQVEQILRRAQANNPLTQTVVIRADKQADWEKVALAIGLCKKVGIHEFTATTDDS
jgi:biopolymer transport protein ExbD